MLWLESERKYHNEHILSHPYFSGCPLSTINPWSFQYTVWLTMSFYLYQFQSDHPWISASPHRCYHRRTWRTGSSESASSEMAAADMGRRRQIRTYETVAFPSDDHQCFRCFWYHYIRICDWHYYCTVSIIFSLFTSSGSSHLASIWQLWHDLQKNSPDSRHRRHRFFPCPPFKSFWYIHHWLPPPSEP